MNLNLVTNPNPITNLDLDTTPHPPRSCSCLQYDFSSSETNWKPNPPDLENQFYIDECSNLSTVALRRAILNGKGFANLS
jgi:hypothetical protein